MPPRTGAAPRPKAGRGDAPRAAAGIILIIGVIGFAHAARADTWTGGLEAGAEADSNVRRVEVGPVAGEAPIAAGLLRLGGHAAGRGTTRYGAWSLGGLGLLRAVGTPDAPGENVAVIAGDARWDVAIPDRTARAFVRADRYDVLGLADSGARTFTSSGADAGLVAVDGERRVTIAAGARDFAYKPDHDFDWRGATLGVRVDATLWRAGGDDDPRALELVADYRLERRRFTGLAFADACMPGAPPMPSCYLPTTAHRADLHHRALAQLTYTGQRVLSAGYELIVSDSNSYGQSLIRHRVLASATGALGARVIATASTILELDQYPAPLLVARDVNSMTFSSIDDDNRNMLSFLVARPIARGWSVEARWAYWADAFSSDAYTFRRQLIYAGVVWGEPR